MVRSGSASRARFGPRSTIRSVAKSVWERVVDGARQSLSIEGLVGVGIGVAVSAIASAVLAQVGEVRIGPAIAAGAGFGLLAAAAFVWLVVRPDRTRQVERDNILRTSARQSLSELANRGRNLPVNTGLVRASWERDVESFLLTAFGRSTAEEVMALRSTKERVARLDDLWRRIDDIRLRPGYRGWRPGL